MERGERITLIKRIASALSEQSWADVELTLRGFEVVFDPDWQGGLYEMVLDAARGADDDTLVELNAHLHPAEQAPEAAAGGPWKPDSFRLFVSHTHAHRKLAGDLRRTLDHVGIDAFVAHDTIEPTRQWLDEIESALQTCDALVAVLTPDFIESRWCDQEVGFCVGRAVVVVPLRMPVDPYGFIGKYQALTVESETMATIAPKVFDLLARHELTRRRMVRPIVQRYVRSRTFQNTRDVFELVKTILRDAWTERLVQDVLGAAEFNTQVGQASIEGTGQPLPEAVREHLGGLGVLPTVHPLADDDIPF